MLCAGYYREMAPKMEKTRMQRITKALGDSTRFEIFERIAALDELACAELKTQLSITPATLSHHIKELASAGLIKSRQQGKCIHLAANRKVWRAYLQSLKKVL
jgi:ArsR family transcriptional regulator, arsenate/arsenite/antimonite-responsive transcriptional repressor